MLAGAAAPGLVTEPVGDVVELLGEALLVLLRLPEVPAAAGARVTSGLVLVACGRHEAGNGGVCQQYRHFVDLVCVTTCRIVQAAEAHRMKSRRGLAMPGQQLVVVAKRTC